VTRLCEHVSESATSEMATTKIATTGVTVSGLSASGVTASGVTASGTGISAVCMGDAATASRKAVVPWECSVWDAWTGVAGAAAHFAARSVVVVVVGVALLALIGLLAGAGASEQVPPTGAIAAEAAVQANGTAPSVVNGQTITTTAHVISTNAHAHYLARLVEWFVACALLLVGLSLLLRARAWMSAFSSAISHPLAPMLTGLYALLMGLFVVLAHNVWVTDARVLVTLVGWVSLVVGGFFLLVPEAYGAVVRRMPITPQFVALRGLLRIGLGGAIATYLLTQG
jgi:hypothetical protein